MEPLTAMMVAAALQGGSIGLRQRAQKNEMKSRRNAVAAERDRQAVYGAEANQILQEQLARLNNPAAQQPARAAELEARYSQTPVEDLSGAFSNPDAPKESNSEIARRMMDAIMMGKRAARDSAKMSSYDLTQDDAALDISDAGQRVGIVQNFSEGSRNVLPYEFERARMDQQGTRVASDAAGALGNLFMMYGVTRPKNVPLTDDQMVGMHQAYRRGYD